MKTYWHRRASLSIGTVTTGAAGSDAEATITEDNVLNLTIPQGLQGEQGEQGIQGPQGEPGSSVPTVASASALGCIKVGTGLTIDADTGVLTADGVNVMTGASSSSDGATGTVPKPVQGDQTKFLRGDATWATPTFAEATTAVAGLMSATDKAKLNGIAAQATKGGITVMYNNASQMSYVGDTTTYVNGKQLYYTGDITDYDLVMIVFADLRNVTNIQMFNTIIVPSIWHKHNPLGGSKYNYYAQLQWNDWSSNKNGARRITICNYDDSDNRHITLSDAYFNGSKNNATCIPIYMLGIKL